MDSEEAKVDSPDEPTPASDVVEEEANEQEDKDTENVPAPANELNSDVKMDTSAENVDPTLNEAKAAETANSDGSEDEDFPDIVAGGPDSEDDE